MSDLYHDATILDFQCTHKLKMLYVTIQWLFMYSLGSIKFLVSEKDYLFIFLYGP